MEKLSLHYLGIKVLITITIQSFHLRLLLVTLDVILIIYFCLNLILILEKIFEDIKDYILTCYSPHPSLYTANLSMPWFKSLYNY